MDSGELLDPEFWNPKGEAGNASESPQPPQAEFTDDEIRAAAAALKPDDADVPERATFKETTQVVVHAGDDDDATPPEPFSSDALGVKYLRRFGAGTRYSPAIGWLVWTGNRWQPGAELIVRERMHGCAAKMAEEAQEFTRDKRTVASLARKICSSGYVAAAMKYVEAKLAVDHDAFDPDPWALNTPGGIVDMRTGGVRPAIPDDMVTMITRVSPVSLCDDAVFTRFLKQITCGDDALAEYLQRACGYFLTADTALHFMMFWTGKTRNGKSTLGEVLEFIAGDYALKLDTEVLMEQANRAPITELAQLRGVRLAISSEASSAKRWNEGRIKELTGDATLTARHLYREPFTFRRTHHHVIYGNSRPIMNGGDAAVAARVHAVPFGAHFSDTQSLDTTRHVYPVDPLMPAKLKACAPAILAWAIKGASKLHTAGLAMLRCQAVQAASADYAADMNSLAMFMEECTEPDMVGRVKASEFYAAFKTWKEARGERAVSMTRLGEEVTKAGIEKDAGRVVHYLGIKLRPGVATSG